MVRCVYLGELRYYYTLNIRDRGGGGLWHPPEQRSTDMIYENMDNEIKLGLHKKTNRKFLPHQPVVVVQCKDKTCCS